MLKISEEQKILAYFWAENNAPPLPEAPSCVLGWGVAPDPPDPPPRASMFNGHLSRRDQRKTIAEYTSKQTVFICAADLLEECVWLSMMAKPE